MKKDNWIIYIIITMTSSTTVLTMWDGSLFGLLRGIGFAVVLDWLIIFWEQRSEKLQDTTQRKWSKNMKWAGVGMLLAIAASYVFVSLVPVDAKKTVDIFGLMFSSTIRELIHWSIVGVISFWVVLTLAVMMYVREIDPDTALQLEYTKAAQERQREKLSAYKIANKYTAGELGKQEALEDYRRDLLNANRYSEGEITSMIMAASQEIDRQKLIPVNTSVGMAQMSATVDGVKLENPTTLSTRQK